MKNRFLSLFIASVMVLGLLAFPATVAATGTVVELDTVTESDTNFVGTVYTVPWDGGDFEFTMANSAAATNRTIRVEAGFVGTITLNGVNIATDGTVAPIHIEPAPFVDQVDRVSGGFVSSVGAPGTVVELFLMGENILVSNEIGGNDMRMTTAGTRNGVPAIFAPNGTALTINADPTSNHNPALGIWEYHGSLEAWNGNGLESAAIGGSNAPLLNASPAQIYGPSGIITINGGRVWALNPNNPHAAAAIGGGGGSRGIGRVVITGGDVLAFTGGNAAAIGNANSSGQQGNANAPAEHYEGFVIVTAGRIRARGGVAIGAANGRIGTVIILPGADIGAAPLTTSINGSQWASLVAIPTAGLIGNQPNISPVVANARNFFYLNRMNPTPRMFDGAHGAGGGVNNEAVTLPRPLMVTALDAGANVQAFADFSQYFGTNALPQEGHANFLGIPMLSEYLNALNITDINLGPSVASGSNRVWNLHYFNNIRVPDGDGDGAEVVFSLSDIEFNPHTWNTTVLRNHLGGTSTLFVNISTEEIPDITLSAFQFSTDAYTTLQDVTNWSLFDEGEMSYLVALPEDAETLTLDIEATDIAADVTVYVNWGSGWNEITNLTNINIENVVFQVRVTVENDGRTSVFTVDFAVSPPDGVLDIGMGDIGGVTLGVSAPGGFPISERYGIYRIVHRTPGTTNNTITIPRGFRGEIILDGVDIQNLVPGAVGNNYRAPISLTNFLHANPEPDRINMTLTVRGVNRLEGGSAAGGNNLSGIFVPRDSTITIQGYGGVTEGNVLEVYSRNAAAIGGNGGSNQARKSGNITINSGTIHAEVLAGSGAGIGGGVGASNEAIPGNFVTITGGNITAIAASSGQGAGIGGGSGGNQGAHVTINGGTIYARGGQISPGIGNGVGLITGAQPTGSVTINDGTVTASTQTIVPAHMGAPGIGGGGSNAIGRIEIHGGTITATGSSGTNNNLGFGAGIGNVGISQGASPNIRLTEIEITGGDITANGGGNAPGIGGGLAQDGVTPQNPVESIIVLPGANLNGSTIGGIAGDIFYFNEGMTFGIGGAGVNSRRLWIVAYDDFNPNTEAEVNFSEFGMGTIELGESDEHIHGRIWRMNFFTNMAGSGDVNFDTVDTLRNEALTATYLREDLDANGRYVFMTDGATPSVGTELIPIPANVITSITINPTTLTLPVDFVGLPETFQLPTNFNNPDIRGLRTRNTVVTANGLPSTATEWVSSDENVARVSPDGNIEVQGVGTAYITLRATDGGGMFGRLALTIVPIGNINDTDQLRNLPAVGVPVGDGWARQATDINHHLAMPTQVGEARVALWRDNATAAFSINSDDNGSFSSSVYRYWLYLTEEHGMPFTFFLEGHAARRDFGTAHNAGWNALIAAGNEVQSHTMAHYPDTIIYGLTSAESLFEFQAAIPYLEAATGQPIRALGFSFGRGIPEHSAWFYAATRGVTGHNRTSEINYRLTGSIGDGTLREHYEGLFRSLLQTGVPVPPIEHNTPNNFGGWLNIHYHPLRGGPNDLDWAGGRDELAGILQRLTEIEAELGRTMWRATYTDIVMYGQSRDSSEIQVIDNDLANGRFSFNLTDRMYDGWFDRPLTVNVKLTTDFSSDNDWQSIRVTQAGSVIDDATVEIINGVGTFAVVNVVPDRGLVVIEQVDSWDFDDSTPGEVTVSLLDVDENLTLVVALYAVEAGGALPRGGGGIRAGIQRYAAGIYYRFAGRYRT